MIFYAAPTEEFPEESRFIIYKKENKRPFWFVEDVDGCGIYAQCIVDKKYREKYIL